MMKRTLFLAVICALLSVSPVWAASRSTCPDKVLEEGSIEGVFQGVECGDFCHAAIELDNGEVFSLLADEEAVSKAFGSGTGQRVSAAYKVEQFWNEPANECSRLEIFASGKVLAQAGGQAAPAGRQTSQPTAPQQASGGPRTGGAKT
ncbi:MAG: hypothetical protein LBP61_07015, partial [Desulfovibrio sp.]|nr:hypothetical protein [Desulfovibrio sp.]